MTASLGHQRIALVVSEGLSAGQAANVSALLMGQISAAEPSVYAEPVLGADGNQHAGIRHSTVVLRAGPGQLSTLAQAAREAGISSCVFSSIGQRLNNAFDEYKAQLERTAAVELVGVGLVGDHETIRVLTKKFSVLD